MDSSVFQQASKNEHKTCDHVNIERSSVGHIRSRTPSMKEIPHGQNGDDSKRHTCRGRVGIDPERDPTEKYDKNYRQVKAIHVKHHTPFKDKCSLWLRENTCSDEVETLTTESNSLNMFENVATHAVHFTSKCLIIDVTGFFAGNDWCLDRLRQLYPQRIIFSLHLYLRPLSLI